MNTSISYETTTYLSSTTVQYCEIRYLSVKLLVRLIVIPTSSNGCQRSDSRGQWLHVLSTKRSLILQIGCGCYNTSLLFLAGGHRRLRTQRRLECWSTNFCYKFLLSWFATPPGKGRGVCQTRMTNTTQCSLLVYAGDAVLWWLGCDVRIPLPTLAQDGLGISDLN